MSQEVTVFSILLSVAAKDYIMYNDNLQPRLH